MHFTILCVGKIKEAYLQEAVADYASRLSKYVRLEITEVSEDNHPFREKRIAKEGEALLRRIAPGSCVIALDLHGREISSEALASYLSGKTVSGTSDFTFVIGGSDGISGCVTSRSDLRLCLSPMTFPHQMMRVILMEQIYRSFKILKNETYHK